MPNARVELNLYLRFLLERLVPARESDGRWEFYPSLIVTVNAHFFKRTSRLSISAQPGHSRRAVSAAGTVIFIFILPILSYTPILPVSSKLFT